MVPAPVATRESGDGGSVLHAWDLWPEILNLKRKPFIVAKVKPLVLL